LVEPAWPSKGLGPQFARAKLGGGLEVGRRSAYALVYEGGAILV